jgi:hypothetical protein
VAVSTSRNSGSEDWSSLSTKSSAKITPEQKQVDLHLRGTGTGVGAFFDSLFLQQQSDTPASGESYSGAQPIIKEQHVGISEKHPQPCIMHRNGHDTMMMIMKMLTKRFINGFERLRKQAAARPCLDLPILLATQNLSKFSLNRQNTAPDA